jgi:DMSO/TMAO reductase YedYZ heme-binding membrane subunit
MDQMESWSRLLHGMITVIEPYKPFGWREVLVPFSSMHAPGLTGLGTLSIYGMLIVIFTTDIRQKIKKSVWMMIHLLSYPIFVMSFIHGYWGGTDSGMLGIKWMYVLSILVVATVTGLRFVLRPQRQARPSFKQAEIRQRKFADRYMR